jgi:hypothetical protein
MASQREQSRKEWAGTDTVEDINSGCFQRIADACEKMAGNHIALQNDLDLYKRWYTEAMNKNDILQRRINAMKGVITKLKKQSINNKQK